MMMILMCSNDPRMWDTGGLQSAKELLLPIWQPDSKTEKEEHGC